MRAMVDRSGDVVAARASREAISLELNLYFEALKGFCPVHFGSAEVLKSCDSYECDRLNPQADWSRYQDFRRSFDFAKYTYCYRCGAPNDQESHNYFALECHPMPYPGGGCPWNHLIFKTIFVLWHRADLIGALCDDLDIKARSLDEFAAWATEDIGGNMSPHYYNGIRMFISYCRYQKRAGFALEALFSLDE